MVKKKTAKFGHENVHIARVNFANILMLDILKMVLKRGLRDLSTE